MLIWLTDHDSSWDSVPLEPKCDKGACHQDNPRDEDGSEVEGPISRED